MSEVTLEVPAHLADRFETELKRRIANYAESAKSGAEFWERNPESPDDLDGALELLNAARATGRREGEDGAVEFTGSPWVLSDTADDVLRRLTDTAQNQAFYAPLPYAEVAELAGQIQEWAKVCERIDATYREAVV